MVTTLMYEPRQIFDNNIYPVTQHSESCKTKKKEVNGLQL